MKKIYSLKVSIDPSRENIHQTPSGGYNSELWHMWNRRRRDDWSRRHAMEGSCTIGDEIVRLDEA